jgi:putative selenate reductase
MNSNRISFEEMLRNVMQEYQKKGSISPKGTIANDLLAAMTRGARIFGIKLIQQEDGTPGVRVLADGVVYSSRNGSPRTTLEEYLKAWFAAELLTREFGICATEDLCFAMDAEEGAAAIPSPIVSDFLAARENPANTKTWKLGRKAALDHLDWFTHIDAIAIYGVIPAQKIA